MKTEKRKAKVGERILITNAQFTLGQYKNGDILTVRESFPETVTHVGHVYVKEASIGVMDKEYEVIMEADNMENVNFRGMSLAELEEFVQKAVKELSKRAFHAGFRDGREAQRKLDGKRDERKKSLQQQRDEIIEKAKRDIDELKVTHHPTLLQFYNAGKYGEYECNAEFIVNKEKRTVVCLMREIQYDNKGEVVSKGIAKCAPDECFNVHIGKAIALRRALGLEVPDEYLNAPQPTEVRVGDIVKWPHLPWRYEVISTEKPNLLGFNRNGTRFTADGGDFERAIVIDDSREEVTE